MPLRARQLSDLQDHRRSWQAFIEAQKAVIRHRERPLKVKLPEEDNFSGDELRLEVVSTDNKTQFYQQAKALLGLREDDIDTQRGLLSLSWDTAVSPLTLGALAESAEKYYFAYRPEPVLQGAVYGVANQQWRKKIQTQAESALQAAGLALSFTVILTHQVDNRLVIIWLSTVYK